MSKEEQKKKKEKRQTFMRRFKMVIDTVTKTIQSAKVVRKRNSWVSMMIVVEKLAGS